MKRKLDKAYSIENFRKQGHELIDIMANYLEDAEKDHDGGVAIPWQHPVEQLQYWKQDFLKPTLEEPMKLFTDVMEKSVQVHRRTYLGHQTTPTLPVTVLSGALISLLNPELISLKSRSKLKLSNFDKMQFLAI